MNQLENANESAALFHRRKHGYDFISGLLVGLAIVMMIAGLYITAKGLAKQSK